MTRLTIYGDFNCPFSALASARVDVLLAAGHEIDWRAVQHDTAIPATGEAVAGDTATGLAAEVATIFDLSKNDLPLHLVVPSVRSNTAVASAAFAAAGDDADRLRRRLFAAVWNEGRNVGDPAELVRMDAVGRDDAIAAQWQDEFESLPRPVTPTLVLPDGYISRGLGALTRLAGLAVGDAVIPINKWRPVIESYLLPNLIDSRALEPQGDLFDAVWHVVNWTEGADRVKGAKD